jgi:hypothetical protein
MLTQHCKKTVLWTDHIGPIYMDYLLYIVVALSHEGFQYVHQTYLTFFNRGGEIILKLEYIHKLILNLQNQ